MLGPRHPQPPVGGPCQPPSGNLHQPPGPPQPPMGNERSHWHPPLATEQDLALLRTLLSSDEEAQSLVQILQNSPPEIAALGYLMLRILERSQAI